MTDTPGPMAFSRSKGSSLKTKEIECASCHRKYEIALIKVVKARKIECPFCGSGVKYLPSGEVESIDGRDIC